MSSNRLREKLIEKYEEAFVRMNLSLEEISERYDIGYNTLALYCRQGKWKTKRSRYKDMIVGGQLEKEKEFSIKMKTALSSEMWEDIRRDIEDYRRLIRPYTIDKETQEKKINKNFLREYREIIKMAREARLMERLEDDQPIAHQKSVSSPESAPLPGMIIMPPQEDKIPQATLENPTRENTIDEPSNLKEIQNDTGVPSPQAPVGNSSE